MGTVYRAHDRLHDKTVALKVLHGEDAIDVERFVREAAILAELDHPNIVRYAGHGVTEAGEHYLAMEWLEGEDLSVRLARARLTDAETLVVMQRTVEAIACAHARGAVHRDIKPSNLFLRGGDVERLAVVDFGIAGLAGETRKLTFTGVLLGTPGYMAPEQVQGPPSHDPRCDIFSMGCVFFECLAGRPAFEGTNPMAVLAKLLLQESPRVAEARPGVPKALDALVTRMLSKDPAGRPQSIEEVRAELEVVASRFGPRALPTLGSMAGQTLHSVEADPASGEHGALTRSEHRVATVVLAGDPNAPKDAAALGHAAVADLAAAVEPFGGHPTPLAGGSLIITTWSPGTAVDRAERAALCALALRERYGELPIAMVTGRGRVASKVVEGEVIDRGVRSLAGASAGSIHLDEATAGMLAARFQIDRTAQAPKLAGARAAQDGIPHLLGRVHACVGRNRELAMLEGIFTGCVTEPVASAALVTGLAGSGKSRLRRELVDRLKRRGEPIEVLIGRADSLWGDSPYGVIADLIRGAAGIHEGEPLDVRRAKLTKRLSSCLAGPMLSRVASFLGELISTPFPDAGDAVLAAARENAMLMGDAMRAAWEEWLIAECKVQPVLVVLEDLHWGDTATSRLVDSTLRNLSELPLMVLALARPDAHPDLLAAWSKRDVPVIKLGPLPVKASERLAQDALGAAATEDVVRRIIERSGGNPFYLEELIRAVASNRGDVLPDSVLGTVEARLDAEGGEAKRALRAASVFGDRFSVSGVAALLGGDRHVDEARRLLMGLAARELIVPAASAGAVGGQDYGFSHALVREAAYATLTEEDRALGHRLAGDWLERAGHTDSLAMAEHFRRGGEPARAVRWYQRAAEQSLEANDLGAAIERAERGVACGAAGKELGALRLVQAEASVWRGELECAEARGVEAVGLLEPGSMQWFRAIHQIVPAAGKLGGFDRVEKWIEVARAAQPRQGAVRAQILCLSECANHLLFGGRYASADKLIQGLDSMVGVDVASFDAQVSAQIEQVRGIRASYAGDLGACLERCVAALDAFEQCGDLRNACTVRTNLGFVFEELGDFEGAEESLRAALAGANRMGLHDLATVALNNLGIALAYLGDLAEARRLEQSAADAFRKQGDPRMEGVARTCLAKIALLSRDHATAEREARVAVDLLGVAPPLKASAEAVLARALLGQGRDAEALAAAASAHATLEVLGALEEGESLVRLVYAEAVGRAGTKEEYEHAIAWARERLAARAARISDRSWRERFLHNVPDNARTIELSGGDGPDLGLDDDDPGDVID
jgi:tetratricopeptide (TPR) repeat protein